MDLWDRLAGEILEYVENYCLVKSQSKIKPSYEVDYEINCLEELKKHGDYDNYWPHQISGCKNINDLPTYLQELVLQYLPRFFIRYPEYQNLDCLKISNLSFLDYGLPVEHTSDVDVSEEIAKFREYCRLLWKKPEQLTKEQLQRCYEIDSFTGKEQLGGYITDNDNFEKDDNFAEIKKLYESKTPSEWENEFEKEKKRLQELKKLGELDDAADKAGGYVDFPFVPNTSYDYREMLKYCEERHISPTDLSINERNQFIVVDKAIKKVKYVGESDSVCLRKGKIYDCIGEEHGEYRIIDEEGYDEDEEVQGYLYPKRFFVEVDDD